MVEETPRVSASCTCTCVQAGYRAGITAALDAISALIQQDRGLMYNSLWDARQAVLQLQQEQEQEQEQETRSLE